MKHLFMVAAGLGFRELERRGAQKMAGLSFAPGASAFPAVTCVTQATLRTGLDPRAHGMTTNGVWLANLMCPSFWEQSAALVEGPRVWDAALAVGGMVHISKLADDFVRFDEFHETLAGGGRTWSVGDKLQVRVEKVDFDRRQVDFVPVAERSARRNTSQCRARRQVNQFQQSQSRRKRK